MELVRTRMVSALKKHNIYEDFMRILFGGLVILAVLIVGALIAPQFVDLNKYKPQITTQVEKATGF